jgi:hypothetical protein
MTATEVLDRRQFVYLVGGIGLGLPLLTGANCVAQEATSQAADERATIGNTTDEVELLAQADDYIQDAIALASSISGDVNTLQQRFEEGNQIFSQAQARLRAWHYHITLSDGTIDLKTPPETFDQFSDFEQINITALAAEGDSARKILAKLLALFGISEFAEVFAKLLAAELEGLTAAVLAANWRLVTTLFFKIIDSVFSRAFLTLLGENVGAKAAAKLGAKIASRCLPFIGWAILIGQFIWALGEEFGKSS